MGREYIHTFPWQGQWRQVSESRLRELGGDTERNVRSHLDAVKDNGMAHFIPHGDGAAFCNDYESDLSLLLAPNQSGKTYQGAMWSLLRLVQCDPSRPVFEFTDITCPGWTGEKIWVCASYKWANVEIMWKRYQALIPREELGRYAPDWGRDKSEKGAPKYLSFDGRTRTLKLERSGSEIMFLCYSQEQGPWESYSAHGGHLDEQAPKEKFTGYIRSQTTSGDDCQTCMTLTGHRVKGRPDTGAAGWIKHDFWDGRDDWGMRVGRYKIGISNVPDVIISKKKKRELKRRWVTLPEKNNDQAKINEGKARYGGGWEVGGGLVLGNLDEATHVIPSFPIPYDRWTLGRSIDHGHKQPCAVVFIAMAPWGDMFIFREYYATGRLVNRNCEEIIAACGNARQVVGMAQNEESGTTWPVYEEEQRREWYFWTVLDGRSFGSKSDRGVDLGELYSNCGLDCTQASGADYSIAVPRMKQWFDIVPSKPHAMHMLWKRGMIDEQTYQKWLKVRRGDHLNGSYCYIFEECEWFLKEARAWPWKEDERSGKERPADKDDHLMTAFKYMVLEQPQFFGSAREIIDDQKYDEVDSGSEYSLIEG